MAEATEAYLSENSPAMFALESIVDRAGLRNVLFALEQICFAKSIPATRQTEGDCQCSCGH